MKEECKSCRFFYLREDGDEYGDCRRYPPRLAVTPEQQQDAMTLGVPGDTVFGLSPSVFACDWCGEFKQRGQEGIELPVLSAFNWTVRTSNCFHYGGIETTEQLLKYGPFSLRGIRNLGETSLREIQKKLQEHGLKLKGA